MQEIRADMTEGIGLTPVAISVTALFMSCIESFDIAVEDDNLSEEHEQLCALVGS